MTACFIDTNLAIAIFTAIAALAALVSAVGSLVASFQANKAAKESRKIAANQLSSQRIADRAWLIISPSQWSPLVMGEDPTQPHMPAPVTSFAAVIKNVGNTPAHLSRIAMCYKNLDQVEFDTLPDEPEYTTTVPLEGHILVPEDSLGLVQNLQPNAVLTSQEVVSIRTSKSFLYFYASIKYNDAFGEEHETRVAYLYQFPQGGLIDYNPAQFQRKGSPKYNLAT